MYRVPGGECSTVGRSRATGPGVTRHRPARRTSEALTVVAQAQHFRRERRPGRRRPTTRRAPAPGSTQLGVSSSRTSGSACGQHVNSSGESVACRFEPLTPMRSRFFVTVAVRLAVGFEVDLPLIVERDLRGRERHVGRHDTARQREAQGIEIREQEDHEGMDAFPCLNVAEVARLQICHLLCG